MIITKCNRFIEIDFLVGTRVRCPDIASYPALNRKTKPIRDPL